MLKVLEDLERAVGRLVEKAGKVHEGSSALEVTDPSADAVAAALEKVGRDPDQEEAAELIRRAIKRLRSL